MLKPYCRECACDPRSRKRPDLQHFDADERIECFLKLSRNLAIIHQVNSDAVLKTECFDPLFGKSLLFLGQSEGVDFAAECPDGLS